jgi:hypothetical protein
VPDASAALGGFIAALLTDAADLWLACSDTLADWGDGTLHAMLDDHGIDEPEDAAEVPGT